MEPEASLGLPHRRTRAGQTGEADPTPPPGFGAFCCFSTTTAVHIHLLHLSRLPRTPAVGVSIAIHPIEQTPVDRASATFPGPENSLPACSPAIDDSRRNST